MIETKARNYYVDDETNRDWLKMLSIINAIDEKAGRFVTIDGKPVFIGGPGAGGGGASGGGSGGALDDDGNSPDDVDIMGDALILSAYEAQKYGDDNWQEWRDDLTFDEEKAIYDYSDTLYEEMNQSLREGNRDYGYIDDAVINLDSALDRGYAPDDLVVWRSMNKERVDSMVVGEIYEDLAFVSTTLDSNQKTRFGPGVMQILVPKGSNCGFLDGLSYFESERELLLPRGSLFRIAARLPDGTVQLELLQ